MSRNLIKVAAVALALGMLAGCARRKKYENPIITNSQQPDKVLFDRAIGDIEHSRFEVARLTLQTLINTYPDSEYLAKAKLAIADSWYRQGGANGLAQAEAEYKDFITFFPNMEEAAESQKKICQIHYQQMEKPDRDPTHAIKAEYECRQLILQFPNSKFVAEAEQMLRDVQEVRADAEFRVGQQYWKKGSYRASSTRLHAVSDEYPLYSRSDEALWLLGDAYGKMGKNFEEKSAQAYAKLVREYPLSPLVAQAKDRLAAMNKPIPDPDEAAVARMQYDLEHREKTSLKGHALGVFSRKPNVNAAAKTGKPSLVAAAPVIPEGMPTPAPIGGSATAEVGATTITGPSALDTQPDARAKPPSDAPASPAASGNGAGNAAASGPAAAAPAAGQAAATPAPAATAGASVQKASSENATESAPPASSSKKKKKGRFLKVIPVP
ncbi:MAG TPA: outer membrane protein assembly factor BamD [Bryobacterales bacterium]|nr:outer membrane protein assembly factor BamD [Bryobacterales bacterium]